METALGPHHADFGLVLGFRDANFASRIVKSEDHVTGLTTGDDLGVPFNNNGTLEKPHHDTHRACDTARCWELSICILKCRVKIQLFT
jgi:hypothetical protein